MSTTKSTFAALQDQIINALLRAFSPARRACARAESLISLNADGQASEAERVEIEAHCERCAACRAIENATLLVRADLRERPRAALPDSLAARLAAAVQDEQRRERVETLERERCRVAALPRLRLAGGAVATAALFGVLVAVFPRHMQSGRTIVAPGVHPVPVPTHVAHVPEGTQIAPSGHKLRLPARFAGSAFPPLISGPSGEPSNSETVASSSTSTAGFNVRQPHFAVPSAAPRPTLTHAPQDRSVIALLPKSETIPGAGSMNPLFPRKTASIQHGRPTFRNPAAVSHERPTGDETVIAVLPARPSGGERVPDILPAAPPKSAQVASLPLSEQPGGFRTASAMQSNLAGALRHIAGLTQKMPSHDTLSVVSYRASGSLADGPSIVSAPASL